ncbi:MAG: LCP family protein [Lachnospiraceae bacterium]|nr:LCP family protein [Lachnospiraceae bacterium]
MADGNFERFNNFVKSGQGNINMNQGINNQSNPIQQGNGMKPQGINIQSLQPNKPMQQSVVQGPMAQQLKQPGMAPTAHQGLQQVQQGAKQQQMGMPQQQVQQMGMQQQPQMGMQQQQPQMGIQQQQSQMGMQQQQPQMGVQQQQPQMGVQQQQPQMGIPQQQAQQGMQINNQQQIVQQNNKPMGQQGIQQPNAMGSNQNMNNFQSFQEEPKDPNTIKIGNDSDVVVYGKMTNMSINSRKETKKKTSAGKIIKYAIISLSVLLVCFIVGFYVKIKKAAQRMEDNGVVNVEVNEENIGLDDSKEKVGYRTLALYGLDADSGGTKRSDTIMVCVINETTGEIKLCSLYRDTFLYVENWTKRDKTQYTKVNAAYTLSPEDALKALNQNLALHVTDYVAVDFITLVRIVDALGGIEVTLPDKDNFIFWLNAAGYEGAYLNKEKYVPLDEKLRGKTVTLTGFQALGYCRVRKASQKALAKSRPLKGESDLTRAARQNEVIKLIFEKVKTNGITSMNKLIEVCQDQKNMSTSLSWNEIKELGKNALDKGYYISDERLNFPENPHLVEMWASKASTQFPENSLLEDVQNLHKKLYPDQELTSSELTKVIEISEQLEKYEQQYGTGTPATKSGTSADTSN